MESSGPEAAELADRAGLHLDDWQAWVLEQGLGERADHDWAAFESCVVVPRQNGKGAIIEALCLAGLFLFEDRLTIYSAHEFKTAQETYRRVDELLAGSDWLRKKVIRKVQSTNESGFELRNGCRLRFLARSKGSGRGFSSRRVIFDEAYDLPATAMSAVMPTLLAQRNAQVWYFSSAGQEDSDTLRALRVRGLVGSERLMYADWSSPDEADPADMAAIAAANPALGIRISEQSIEDMRRSLDPVEFAREVMGVWDQPAMADEDRIPADAWLACTDPASSPVGPVVFSVDMSPDGATCSIGVAGHRDDGSVHIGVVDSRYGTEWVPDRLTELLAKHGTACGVVWQPTAPIGLLAARFELVGVPMVAMTATEMAQACGALKDDVINGRVHHQGTAVLEAAFASGERRVGVEGAWTWGRRKSAGDISPLVAVTEALWGLAAAGSGVPNVYDF